MAREHKSAIVTLDYYDGSESKTVLMDLDEVSTRISGLMFKLMQANTAGITITKHVSPAKMVDKMINNPMRKEK